MGRNRTTPKLTILKHNVIMAEKVSHSFINSETLTFYASFYIIARCKKRVSMSTYLNAPVLGEC